MDLGQRADLAREPEPRLELLEPRWIVGQPRANTDRHDLGLRRLPLTTLLGADGRRVLDAFRELGQEQVGILGPRRHREVVEGLTEMAVLGQEGFEVGQESCRVRMRHELGRGHVAPPEPFREVGGRGHQRGQRLELPFHVMELMDATADEAERLPG